jgi:iron(III) transport system permease protein
MSIPKSKIVLPIALLAFVYIGYVLYPLLMTLSTSFQIEGQFSFGNYADLVSSRNTANLEAIWNSILVSVLSVVCSGILGVFFAFVFTQCDVPLRSIVSRIAILPIALPPLVGVISFLFVFGESGILPRLFNAVLEISASTFSLDGFSAIVAVHTYSFYVYFYLFVSTTLENLDSSQLEAAQTFGSSTWRTIRYIILPELRPSMVGASILTFMTSMASFSAPLLFAGDRRFMTLQIYNAKLNGELNVAATASVGLAIISILFFIGLRAANPPIISQRKKGTVRVGVLSISKALQRVLVTIALVILTIELLPILAIVLIAFAQEGSWTWQIVPTEFTFENYSRLFFEPQVFEPMWNSAAMSALTVVAAILVGVTFAYIVTKGNLTRSQSLAADLLATMPFAIPGTVVAIGMILAFNSPTIFSGNSILVGTFWILPLAYFVRTFPFVVRSTSASLQQVDDSLLEAGKTFGVGGWRMFRTITLPMILPGVVSGGLLVVITALGEFVSSVLLYSYSNRPIAVEILAQMRGYNFGSAAAYSVLLLVLVVLLTFASNLLAGRGVKTIKTSDNWG